MNQDHVVLNRTNQKMPLIGYGCWKVDKDQCADTIYNAIKVGYRLIDSAAVYANEVEVGQGIERAIKEGIVKREDLFVVTKLWNTCHHKDNVRPALQKSLKDLNLSYIDLYLIHFPIPLAYADIQKHALDWFEPGTQNMKIERSPLQETWREMERAVDDKLVRNIGVSNCNVQTILDMLTYAKYKPATLQIEHHPYLQQNRLIKWVKSQGIHITAYSSFGPISYLEMSEQAKNTKPLLDHDVIKSIASKHGKTTGQVLLRWAVQRDVAVIPKSMNMDRMKSNLDVFSWSLDDDDLAKIADMDIGLRFNDTVAYGLPIPLFD
ncbi:xylose reductase [Radiomyces spectabilis]|uniref:xylose reductase n=1 Tax=Radiomyces spectabilis TaxID=64574 RepID=UPI00221E56D0|nr:xylose reductase [Radiomyces spectabilis]KAI8377977.1 xylose reductase [Radiomyces spectabilis]